MPNYTRLPEDLVAPPPYDAADCQMHMMFLDGKQGAQQRFCDAALNRASDGQCQFSAVTNKVLFALLYSKSMRSTHHDYGSIGYTQEIDIGFWTLVKGGVVGGPQSYYWMPSYLFVDSASAQAAGRENFGYPKSVGLIERTSEDLSDVRVTVDSPHFPTHRPDQPLVSERLITVTQPEGGIVLDLSASGVFSFLKGVIGDSFGLSDPDIALPYFDIPQIMLRQIRHATRSSDTSVKEILVAKPRIKLKPNIRILTGGANVRILPSASHDIMGWLGLPTLAHASQVICAEASYTVASAKRLWPV